MQTRTIKVRTSTSHDLCETEAGAKEAERYEQEDNRLQINEVSVMYANKANIQFESVYSECKVCIHQIKF